MARLAYPELTLETRDKVTYVQFISALSDSFMKRTLQLEEVDSLKSAIERSIASHKSYSKIVLQEMIKMILRENFILLGKRTVKRKMRLGRR